MYVKVRSEGFAQVGSITRKGPLWPESLPYQKNDGHAWPRPFFWYDTNVSQKDSNLCSNKNKNKQKVGVIPKEGWVRPHASILLLVWHQLMPLGTFLHNAMYRLVPEQVDIRLPAIKDTCYRYSAYKKSGGVFFFYHAMAHLLHLFALSLLCCNWFRKSIIYCSICLWLSPRRFCVDFLLCYNIAGRGVKINKNCVSKLRNRPFVKNTPQIFERISIEKVVKKGHFFGASCIPISLHCK